MSIILLKGRGLPFKLGESFFAQHEIVPYYAAWVDSSIIAVFDKLFDITSALQPHT